MTQFVQHIAMQGERWDQIAARYYGDSTQYARIIDANPFVPITPSLDAGVALVIPVDDTTTPTPADIGLPPWKR